MKTVKFVFILFGICLLMSTCNNNTPVRHLPMEGGYNFRDLGGYKTTDGKSVKWGKIFRSDDLANLTENDLAYLSAIPIVSIVDFRSESEMENAPDKLPASVENYCPLSVSPGNMDSGSIMNPSDSISPEQMMEQINILLVSDSAIIAQYKTFFALLQEKENIPLLFHCSAGKDRTGMGAALILFALGVDEETIFEDYLASNNYLEGKYSNMITAYPELTPFFTVKEEYLKSGLNTIKKEYGSIKNYLTTMLDVDIENFRKLYLE